MCRTLARDAVQRPYGWAWRAPQDESTATDTEPPTRNDRVVVSFDPTFTPGAAFVLAEASRHFNDPALLRAANETARGIMAAQEKTGRIPARAMFGRSAEGMDELVAEPDRAPTRAGLAVLLMLADQNAQVTTAPAETGTSSNDRLMRSASRCAHWLLKQQAQTGGWPVAEPPDAPTGKAERIVRLDTSEYRDSTLALMLSAYMLDDKLLKKGATDAVRQLQLLRLDTPGHLGRGLWGTAYQPNGTPDRNTLPESDELDLLATRNVMLTLLAAHLMMDDASALELLDKSAAVVERLKSKEGTWPRFPGRASTDDALAVGAATVPFDDVLAAIAEVHKSGRDRAIETLSAPHDARRHVVAVLCGLVADPFVLPGDDVAKPVGLFASQSPGSIPSPALLAWRELSGYVR